MFNTIKIKEVNFNTNIALPNYIDSWLDETDIHKILFLYTYIRINQLYINGHYRFNTFNYLSLIYTPGNIKSNWKKLIQSLNDDFKKLKVYELITADIIVEKKLDIIDLDYYSVVNEFEVGFYTLIDYSILNKIFTTDADVEKDKLLLCCFFLNNRARDKIGFTSFDDIGQILGSKATINKYLTWFKDNKIFDYYSTNHKLDSNGIPKRGNTTVAKWENRELINEIRKNDTPCKNSAADVKKLDEEFKDDIYYCKLSKVLKKYGLVNNFLLQRLWNELPFGFTWEAIYRYLNAFRNVEYFTHEYEINDEAENEDDDVISVPITDKTKIVNKIVNVAKTQEKDILCYIAELYNCILKGETEDILVGRIYDKNKSKAEVKQANKSKPENNSEDVEEEKVTFDDLPKENKAPQWDFEYIHGLLGNDDIKTKKPITLPEDKVVTINTKIHKDIDIKIDTETEQKLQLKEDVKKLIYNDDYWGLTEEQKQEYNEKFSDFNKKLERKTIINFEVRELRELKQEIIDFYDGCNDDNEELPF